MNYDQFLDEKAFLAKMQDKKMATSPTATEDIAFPTIAETFTLEDADGEHRSQGQTEAEPTVADEYPSSTANDWDRSIADGSQAAQAVW